MAIAAKPERPLAEVIQRNATLLGFSYGDYLVWIAANVHNMPELAPQPTKTLETLDGLNPQDSPADVDDYARGSIPSIATLREMSHQIAS
ncbi:hypothetical protein ABXJ56_15545 [Microbacterium chocolatum]|uniref:hypothetical protein n=1 Tax=Microbacterium aurantiacum TaxID=162393 RepID=UPI0033905D38